MSFRSKIEWTQATWNPVTGCSKISTGCLNCYAERLAHRLHKMGNPSYVNDFSVTLHEKMLLLPYKWKKPQIIFVNSMSDLFHEDVPVDFIKKIFDVISSTPHIYQILTKRSTRMAEILRQISIPRNAWIGVTVEHSSCIDRIEDLREVQSRVRFLSLEPLLSSLDGLTLSGIDWVIVGGESGPKSRPIKEDWVTAIRDKCIASSVPFFFKQWGGTNKKKAGRKLEGKVWSQMPKAFEEYENNLLQY